jgi:hypothetical protein
MSNSTTARKQAPSGTKIPQLNALGVIGRDEFGWVKSPYLSLLDLDRLVLRQGILATSEYLSAC